MVRTLGYKYLKLLHRFVGGKSPAESAEMQWTYVSHHANDAYSGGSESEMSQRFWIQMITHTYGILAAKKDCLDFMYNC